MVRPPYVDSNGIRKGAWSEEEDNKLRAYILRHGHWNWRLLPKYAGLARCGKSCRLRWVNYLRPGLKKGNFSKQEEDLVIQLHAQLGNKWSVIAANLPGRSDNEIKNFWHTRVDKRRKRNNPAAKNNIKGHTNYESKAPEITLHEATSHQSTSLDIADPSLLSIIEEDSSNYLSALDRINADDDHISISSDYVAQPIQGDFWTDQSFSTNISNSQSEISYASPLEEGDMGWFYDNLLQYFDQWNDRFV